MAIRQISTGHSTDCYYFLFNENKLCDKDHMRGKIRLDIWTWKLYDLNITVYLQFLLYRMRLCYFSQTKKVEIYR